MNQISNEHNSADIVVTNDTTVSLQVFQDVYHSITGKTEHSSRLLYDHHRATIDDFRNLHLIIQQTIEQFDIVSWSCCVTVRYSNTRSERHSAFSRFEAEAPSKGIPVEDVALEYDFAIRLPKTSEARTYKLTIGTRSTVGILDRFERTGATEIEKNMFFNYDNATAKIDIEYVDLAVARNLEAQVEDWYRGLKKRSLGRFAALCKKAHVVFGITIRILTIVASVFACIALLRESVVDEASLYKALAITLVALSMATIISVRAQFVVERWLKRLTPVSSVVISAADEDAEKDYQKDSIISMFKSLGAILLSIATGLFTTYLAVYFGIS